jgi:hypothetical protein
MRISKTEKRIAISDGESREFRGATKNHTETYRPKIILGKVSGAPQDTFRDMAMSRIGHVVALFIVEPTIITSRMRERGT